MVKPLAFKGEKPKKRKRTQKDEAGDSKEDGPPNPKTVATTATATSPASQQQQHQQVDDAAEDENWVSAEHLSDIAGPIMFVLPTSSRSPSPHPPASLSVDQLGKVFAQKIENLVEGLPDSAEPHDVRQVWIATRV
ncbi:hypothetical protein KC351_g6842, partial [Hortaea werneckii]